ACPAEPTDTPLVERFTPYLSSQWTLTQALNQCNTRPVEEPQGWLMGSFCCTSAGERGAADGGPMGGHPGRALSPGRFPEATHRAYPSGGHGCPGGTGQKRLHGRV